MYLTLQTTMSCHACGHAANPVNAMVDAVTCRGCGASIVIPNETWTAALEAVLDASEELADNARGFHDLASAGGSFRVGYARQDPRCPHCSEVWSAAPTEACPSCLTPVSRRASPHALPGLGEVIGEDRGLLSGQDLSLGCRSCGAPLDVGAERQAHCTRCDAQTIVPDEVWRRLNAPDVAGSWLIEVGEVGSDNPLAEVGISHLAVGADGTVFVTGSTYTVDCVIIAVEPDLRRRRWTHALSTDLAPVPVPLPDGRVVLVAEFSPDVLVADDKGVRVLATLDGDDVQDAALCHGSIVLARGMFRTLFRLGADGTLGPVWPPAGFFRRLLGADGPAVPTSEPCARPTGTMTGRMGSGHDGDLRLAWGPWFVHYARDGSVTASHRQPDWHVSLIAPVGAKDGTSYIAFSDSDTRWTVSRIPLGGEPERIHQADIVTALGCTPDGHLLMVWGNHVDGVGTQMRLSVRSPDGHAVRDIAVG